MRLHLILPRVESDEIKPPSECPYEGCECMRCFRTHRVCPKGVSRDHISQRMKGLGILLYLLGLS